jgi:hypothetical protein
MIFSPLNFPKASLKLTQKDNQIYVWCILRNKNLVLTPEEWVRQHVIHFLINTKKYPKGLLVSEYTIEVNKTQKRSDLVVFGKDKSIKMLIECKSVNVQLSENTLFQISQYTSTIKAKYLWISNGISNFIFTVDSTKMKEINIETLPDYNNL